MKQSPHFDERNGAKPRFIILHYTESLGPDDPDGYFMATKKRPDGLRVSAHYMIDEDGTVTQYVQEDKRAWHAGVSHWGGTDDLNTHSIGIELVNPGRKYGYRAFPQAQIDSLRKLCKDIVARHSISPFHILAHSDVAPGRKIDPGELFPWRELAVSGAGVWPAPIQQDFNEVAALMSNPPQLKLALVEYGYNPACDAETLIREFQRHFQPEAFQVPGRDGKPDPETALRLAALLRAKRSAPAI